MENDNNQIECDRCGSMHDVTASYRTEEGNICSDCRNAFYFRCSKCEELHANEDGVRACGSLMCISCRDDNYTYCDHCGEWDRDEDSHEITSDNTMVCDSCFDDYYETCNDCEATYGRDDGYYVSGYGSVCDNCRDYYYYCNECGEYHEENNGEYDDDDNWTCDRCLNGRSEHIRCGDGVQQASNTFKEIAYENTYGIELETSKAVSESMISVFSEVHDGSITGKEYVSPILQGDEGLQKIREFCYNAVKAKAEVDNACGYHVHIGSGHLNFQQIKNVWWLYKYFEPVFYAMLPKSRSKQAGSGSCWCAPINDMFTFKQIENCENNRDLMRLYYNFRHNDEERMQDHAKGNRYANQRYRSINLHSHWYRGTIEFRGHSGTLDSRKTINWLKLHLLVVDLATNTPFDKLKKDFPTNKNRDQRAQLLVNAVKVSKLKNDAIDLCAYMNQRISKFNPPIQLSLIEGISPITVKKFEELGTQGPRIIIERAHSGICLEDLAGNEQMELSRSIA